jgi:SAM-dependent MidA family methyltransferase
MTIVITFAEHMEQALYGPGGYYSSGAAKSGKAGDYFTAPDVGAVFGRLLAEIFRGWREKLGDPFTLVEAGAGEGRLAGDILKAASFRYAAVERSESRREMLKRIPGVEVYPGLDSMPPVEGVIFGNELIDAFPVHRVRMKNGAFEEAYVGAGTRPAPTMEWSSPSTPRLEAYFRRLGITLPDDYETEVNLAMADWLQQTGRVLKKGLLLLIDYGRPAHEYYAPERTRGTLRAFSKHKVTSRFLEPGVDLTADVDFTSLALDARAVGFVPLAFMEMGTFLLQGLQAMSDEQRAMSIRDDSTKDVAANSSLVAHRSSLKYLLHPEGLGGAFHVLVLGKNIDPAEWAFEHHRLRRLGLPE